MMYGHNILNGAKLSKKAIDDHICDVSEPWRIIGVYLINNIYKGGCEDVSKTGIM